MAISWRKRTPNTNDFVDDGVSHVGVVMSNSWMVEERVQSDIYANVSYCRVWNPKTKEVDQVCLGHHFELGVRFGTATIDCDPVIMADIKAKQEAAEKARDIAAEKAREDLWESDAKESLMDIHVGCQLVVVKGRKVPKGTTGVCIFHKAGNYGMRVGIKNSSQEEPFWTSADNCEVVFAGLKPGEDPEGGWQALQKRVRKAKEAWQASFPVYNSKVVLTESGLEGTVRWVRGERLGVVPKGMEKKKGNYTWCNAWDVQVRQEDGSLVTPARYPEAIAATPAVPRANPLAHFPPPFCNISHVRRSLANNLEWRAYTSDGVFLMVLSEDAAKEIRALLGAA